MIAKYRAARFPVQPGPAAWNALLPPQPPAEPIDADTTADVVVIGAGIAGLSAALRLAQNDPKLRVLVLEAGRVAEGPAGRNSGFMIDLPHDLSSKDYAGAGAEGDQLQIDLNRRAIGFATTVAEQAGLDQNVFNPSGKINAAATQAGDRHNVDYASHLAALGERYEMLDARQMRDITGTGYYLSGLHTPGTVMLQPAAYVRAMAAVSRQRGIVLHEESPVRAMRRDASSWTLNCGQTKISTGRIVLAVNGHAESFGLFARRLLHVFTYASMTEPYDALAHGLEGEPIWSLTPADPSGSTLRRIATPDGDRIVVRTRFTCNPSMRASDRQVAAAGHLHDRAFVARFPQLAGIRMQYRWAGHLCLSRNGVPAFGQLEEGLFSACCQNGLGLARGTLSGIAAADLACGIESVEANGLAGLEGPARLPPRPLTWIGANAVMRWKEWVAGREC